MRTYQDREKACILIRVLSICYLENKWVETLVKRVVPYAHPMLPIKRALVNRGVLRLRTAGLSRGATMFVTWSNTEHTQISGHFNHYNFYQTFFLIEKRVRVNY